MNVKILFTSGRVIEANATKYIRDLDDSFIVIINDKEKMRVWIDKIDAVIFTEGGQNNENNKG